MKVVALIGVMAFGGQLGAAIVNVSDYNSLKTAIQNANNSASGGDTIVLANGTYTITSPIGIGDAGVAIDIMKPITLKSANGAGNVTINANGLGIGIRTAASGTVIDGLTVTNSNWGVMASDWRNNTVLSGVVFRNLAIATTNTSSSAHGIQFNMVNDSVIELCTVNFAYHQGIYLTSSNRNLVINNTVAQTSQDDGIAIQLSDHNIVTGNTTGTTSTGFDGIFLIGAQYNYVGFNTILNPHNGVTLTRDTGTNRFSIRNWVGNNHIVLHNVSGSDGLWFNDTSNYNMAFGNDATGAEELGMALYTSVGNYLQGNVFFSNPQGGIYLNSNATGPTADRNVVQQNYLYYHPANGGVTTMQSTNDDVGFNFIAGNPALYGNPIAGLLIQGSTGEKLYSNVIKDLRQPENIGVTFASTTGGSLYLNRHFHSTDHYSFTPSATTWDSGSAVLGGNYYSDFTTANGNPSSGSTPYTNILPTAGAYRDNYPYQSEALGKSYGVLPLLPAAGATLAAGTAKTISWVSQGCVYVDLTLLNAANNPTTIVSNNPDYGFYRWTVPAVTPGAYTIKVSCKDSNTNATGITATTSSFNITTSDLALLSPQRDLMVDSGAAIRFAWKKSSNVAGVDVYIRYSDSASYTLLQSGVTNDFVTLTPPSPPASNRVNVKIVSGSYGDSTDGWFSIRSSSSGQFTSPAAAGGTMYVGTPYLLEWVSPTGTDYVDIDLTGGSTRNIATKLADFGRYLVLIPDVQGASTNFRLTFHNSAGTTLGTANSLAKAIAPGGGFSFGGGTNCTAAVSSPTSLAAGGAAGTVTITINGGSCGWTATQNVAWLTPAALSGFSNTLSVTVAANATGAQRSGTVTVAGTTITVTQAANNSSQTPVLVSLSPYQGTGLSANLTFIYSDPNGWAAIASAEFIVNPRWEPANRGGGCYVKYAPGTGLFTLIADDGSSVAGTTAPGSGTNISNSQCTLNAAASPVTGSGNNLTVAASLTFQPTFTGQRHIWMQASDYYNNTTNWLVYGAWFPTQTSVNAFGFYRIYDPNSHSYLNGDINEYNYLGTQGFTQLGEAGLIMDSPGSVGGVSNIAWYRLYVNANSSHFYTSDRNEFLYWNNQQQSMVGEGVAGFMVPYLKADGTYNLTPPTNMIAFYRAGLGTNLHYWTSDADEFFGRNGKHLPTGYAGEGIACWIFPASGAVWNDAGITETAPAPVDPDDAGPAVVVALNAASRGTSDVIAPGQVLSVFGRHLGGAKLLLNGAPVEVISSKDNEIRVVVPRDFVSGMEVSLEVEHRGRRSKPLRLGVVQANPAIFGSNEYGRGNAQAQNEDGVINGAEHPAARGSVVTLYTTGLGAMDLPVEVHIGGRAAEVISVVVSATRAGVVEVRVRVPETVEAAAFQPVVLRVGNLFSQPGVGLAIR